MEIPDLGEVVPVPSMVNGDRPVAALRPPVKAGDMAACIIGPARFHAH